MNDEDPPKNKDNNPDHLADVVENGTTSDVEEEEKGNQVRQQDVAVGVNIQGYSIEALQVTLYFVRHSV